MGGRHGSRRRVKAIKDPVSAAEKWAWLLERGDLDFPDRVVDTQTTADGTKLVFYALQSRADVQELARQVVIV